MEPDNSHQVEDPARGRYADVVEAFERRTFLSKAEVRDSLNDLLHTFGKILPSRRVG